MGKIIILLGVCFMSVSTSCFADTAATSWNNPRVPAEIRSKVLYLPISDVSVTKISIKESKEELIDLLKINNPRIRPLSFFTAEKAPYDGYSKVRLGVYKRLLKMLDILPKNVGIVYSEGFRTLSKQKEYFDKKYLELLAVMHNREKAYREAAKYVSPFIDNIPTHATGAAIDMTLFKIEGNNSALMDMGKYDVISGLNNQHATFSKNTTLKQRANRLLLLKSAIKAGFVNYGFEWWHYSYGDKMHARIYNKKDAIYGLVENKYSPLLSITKKEYLEQMVPEEIEEPQGE